jgi:cytochrome c
MKVIYIAMMAAAGVIVAAQAQAADESAQAQQKNCFTCHQVDKKVIGPAYKDVAAKYKASDIPTLVEKVKKGGSGVWGAVPMAPNNVTDDEAKRLVTWILSHK